MGFIRIKKIKGKEYAYLVENKWYKRGFAAKGKGSRQSVSKYLGRVYSFGRAQDIGFLEFLNQQEYEQYLIHHTQEEILRDLVLWELARNGVERSLFVVDFKAKKIRKDGKEVSLKFNEGFLNSYTLRRLYSLDDEDSMHLAKCFIEAGIEIPKEVFVGLFVE